MGGRLFSQGSMKGTLTRERLVGHFLCVYFRSCLRSFFLSFASWLVGLLICWFVDFLMRSLVHVVGSGWFVKLVCSFIRLLICFVNLFVCSFARLCR